MEINRNHPFQTKLPNAVIDAPSPSKPPASADTQMVNQGEKVTLSSKALQLSQQDKEGLMTPMSGGGTELPPWPPEDES
jgi:hypothetical protein